MKTNKSLLLVLSIMTLVSCGSNTSSISQNKPSTTTTTATPTTSLIYSDEPTRFDEEYHYYKCLNEGVDLEKKEEHDKITTDVVEPTTTSTGRTESSRCSICEYVYSEGKELPILNEENYTLDVVTKYVDGVGVCDTIVYTLKDTNIGDYSFTVVTKALESYIHAGTSYYSIDRWNQLFTNQVSTFDKEKNELTITLKEGTTTVVTASDGVSPLDGVLDLLLYDKVIITGKGTLDITYSTLQDGINANSFIIDEGATVNLTGFSTEDKSAIKVYERLTVNGTFSVSNFGYAQAITNDESLHIVTSIGKNGVFNTNKCLYGIYAWSNAYLTTPTVINEGKLNITEITHYGINFSNADGSIYLRGDSEIYISSGDASIYRFNNLYVGDGETGEIQNNAKLTCISSNDNVIYTRTLKSNTTSLVFNTKGKVLVESTIGDNSKSGIQVACSALALFSVSCVDMTIKGCYYAIGTWQTQSVDASYDYASPNAKITIDNCASIEYSKNGTTFSCFNSETVIVK